MAWDRHCTPYMHLAWPSWHVAEIDQHASLHADLPFNIEGSRSRAPEHPECNHLDPHLHCGKAQFFWDFDIWSAGYWLHNKVFATGFFEQSGGMGWCNNNLLIHPDSPTFDQHVHGCLNQCACLRTWACWPLNGSKPTHVDWNTLADTTCHPMQVGGDMKPDGGPSSGLLFYDSDEKT